MVVKKKTTSIKKSVTPTKKVVSTKKIASAKKATSVKKPIAKKSAIKKAELSEKKVFTPMKREGGSCVYSHSDVDKLLDSTPKFSKFYHWMTGLVYIGIMLIVWGVVYYAYSVDKQIYDLFCINCGNDAINVVKVTITLWLFALYFYFLCELRCRAWDMCIFTSEASVKKTNKWISAMSVLFTGLTSMFFWF